MKAGDVIRSYRHHQEMSRVELANALGMRTETLRQVEEGTDPRPQTLQRIFQWMSGDSITVPMPIIRRSSANHIQGT